MFHQYLLRCFDEKYGTATDPFVFIGFNQFIGSRFLCFRESIACISGETYIILTLTANVSSNYSWLRIVLALVQKSSNKKSSDY